MLLGPKKSSRLSEHRSLYDRQTVETVDRHFTIIT